MSEVERIEFHWSGPEDKPMPRLCLTATAPDDVDEPFWTSRVVPEQALEAVAAAILDPDDHRPADDVTGYRVVIVTASGRDTATVPASVDGARRLTGALRHVTEPDPGSPEGRAIESLCERFFARIRAT